jgi:hypothetical protein
VSALYGLSMKLRRGKSSIFRTTLSYYSSREMGRTDWREMTMSFAFDGEECIQGWRGFHYYYYCVGTVVRLDSGS